MSIALMESGAAEAALKALTGREDAAFLIKHPDDALTLSEVFEIRRERGDGASIVVTCDIEDVAAAFAKARGMEIIDKKRLVKRIRKTGLYQTEQKHDTPILPGLDRAWRNIHIRPRMAMYGLGLMSMYFVTGKMLCLVCGLGTLGIMGVKLIERYA